MPTGALHIGPRTWEQTCEIERLPGHRGHITSLCSLLGFPTIQEHQRMPSTARLGDISGCSLMPSVTINVGLVEEQSLGPPP